MTYNPVGKKFEENLLKSGVTKWKSPSNIALVKYWGKYGIQLPRNPSISFTLDNAHSITEVEYSPKEDNEQIDLSFSFEGKPNEAFGKKIKKYLEKQMIYFPWITQMQLKIKSENSFPHSSGIASSASSMSALVMCLLDIESELSGSKISTKKASFLSRLASGSASRSVFPELSIWGAHSSIDGSSNLFAISYEKECDPLFSTFHDDILIVSNKEKSVSSTAGHQLMESNVYAEQIYGQASDHLMKIIRAMKEGDMETFGEIVEAEAMTLHALMMCSSPSYVLMEPNTLNIISEIRSYRKETGVPVYFTLDAGPNIHMLYPDKVKKEIHNFTEERLKRYCVNGKIIRDQVGQGPSKL